jgi:O-antigen/teichoic acid export membrane protein
MAVLVQLALTIILIWHLRQGAGAAIAALIVFAVISLAGYTALVWTRLDLWTLCFCGAFLRRCLKLGLVYLASSVSVVLNDTGVIVLLGLLGAPTSDIGICAVACSLLIHIELVPQTVANVLLPHFSNDRENIAQRTPSIFRQALICSAFSIPALAAMGLPVLLIIFGRQYAMSVLLVLMALPGTIAAGAGRILEVHLNVLERPQYGLLAGCVRLGLLFALTVVAYRIAGLPGIGLAVMISRMAWLLVLVYFFLPMTQTPLRELLPRRTDLKSFLNSTAESLLRFGRSAQWRMC